MAVTIDDSRIIAYVEADLTRGTVSPRQVVCTQYDAEMRVIAVRLKQNGKDWGIPAGYSVNVRMRKADGTSVYNPQQGEGNIAYITLSAQMCGVEGEQKFVVEIVSGSDVAQTAPIELRVIKNPIEDKDFTSEDEKETIQQAVKDAQDAAEESQENANQAYTWAQNTLTLYHQTENLKNDTQTLRDQAQTAATTAQTLAAQVEDYAEKVLGISVPAVALSQSEYDALDPPDPKTIYIVESDGPQNSLVANYPLTQSLADGMDGSKVATATGCQGLGDWDGTGLSFNTAPASGSVGQHQNYITLPSNLLSGMSFAGGITLALDLKPSATAAAGNGDWTRLINLYKHSNSPAGTAEGELYLTQGLIATAYYDGVTDQYLDDSKAALITAGNWHTVAVVLSATELIVYLDGSRIGSVNNTGNLLAQLSYMDTNEIGNSRFADNDYAGLVRNFRIYDKALSAAEIGQLGQETTWKLYYGAAQDETLNQLQKAIQGITNGTTELPYLKTSGGAMTGAVDMDSHAITGLPDPTADTDAIPKGWADGRYTPLAAAIRPTVTGNPIHVEDSAEAPVQGLCVYGRTEQVTTTGAQLIPLTEETYTNAGLTAELQADGSLVVNGTPNKAYSRIASFNLLLEPGIYFISGGETEKVYAQISINKDGSTSYKINGSFTIDGTESSIKLDIQSGLILDSITNYKIDAMLNKGDHALPIEPYTGGKPSPSPEYPQELVSAQDVSVTVCGANLWSGGDFTFSVAGSSTGYGIAPDDLVRAIKNLPVGTYSCSYTPKGSGTLGSGAGKVAFYSDGSGSPILQPTNTFELTQELKEQIALVSMYGYLNQENSVSDFMLNTGSTTLTWEPYTGKTLTLTGDLPGIPVDSGGNYTDPDGQRWVCNYRDWARGVDVKRVELFPVTDTTAIRSLAVYDTKTFNGGYWPFRVSEWDGKIQQHAQAMSNIFPFENTWGQAKEAMYTVEKTIDFNIEFSRIGVTSETEETQAVAKAKQWLTTQSAVFLCQLIKPIETPIPAEELAAYKALQTYNGTTNVTATDGAGLSLRYVADTQKYIDNKIAELQQQLAETQNALLEG